MSTSESGPSHRLDQPAEESADRFRRGERPDLDRARKQTGPDDSAEGPIELHEDRGKEDKAGEWRSRLAGLADEPKKQP